MAFKTGTSSKEAFKKLRKLTPQKRIEEASKLGGASFLSTLTPQQFAELFPDYYRRGLPDVSGFRAAISQKSTQKQEDISYGLSQGANSIESAERIGAARRKGESSSTSYTGGGEVRGRYNAAQAAALIRQAGGTAEEARILGAIAMPESSGNPQNHNPNAKTGDDSYGLWQINLLGKLGPDRRRLLGLAQDGSEDKKLFDPRLNAKAALMLLRGQLGGPGGYQHWTTYNAGKHSQYLTQSAQGASGEGVKLPDDPSASNVSKASSKSGNVFGNGECVSLSKHFAGNLGPASKWTFTDSKIQPGAVIATTSYGKGPHPGGQHASDTPDGKSHYHTGIALTAPDAQGNVLILEQFQGQGARVAKVNINDYRGSGERLAVVAGGEPSASTLQAVEMGKSLANQDQLAWINGSAPGVYTTEPGQKPSGQTAVVQPAQQASVAKPTFTSSETPAAYPEQQQQSAPRPQAETAKVEKVDASKKAFDSYKFDPDKYWNEVKTKQPLADSMFYGKEKVMQMTYKGFEEAQAAGAIKWNKKTNEIQILDPNHEKVQSIYKDMQDNNIDRSTFMSKTEAGDGGSSKPKKKLTASVEKAPDVFIPQTRSDIGSISGQWESGKFGAESQFGVGSISTGKGDKGGKSYGQHQLSSKKGTMADFLNSDEGKPFAKVFGKTRPGSAEFDKIYSHIATAQPEAFAKAQHSFLDRTHYQPALKTAAQMGYDVKDPRVQEAIWAGGVQFRNNMPKILTKPSATASIGKSPEEQVTALATAKQQYAPKVQNRFQYEAQAILGQTPGGGYEKANVMDINKYADYMTEQKSRQASFIAEQNKTKIASAKSEAPIRSTAIPLITPSTAAAATDTHPVTPGVSAKESFDRMRHMTAPESYQSAPQTPEAPKTPERHSSIQQIQEKAQNPVSINPRMEKGMTESPSLARAMDKIRGVESSQYSALNKTTIG